MERYHLPACLSRKCFNLELATSFLKSLGQRLGTKNFPEFLRVVREQRLYPAAESVKDLTVADQEWMQQLERSLYSRRTNFLITVSPPNTVGSLLNWRLIAVVLNHLGVSQPQEIQATQQPLVGTLHGPIIDAHCHLPQYQRVHPSRDPIETLIFRDQSRILVTMEAIITSFCFPDQDKFPSAAELEWWQRRDPPMYSCVGIHPRDCNRVNDRWLQKLEDTVSSPHVVALGEVGLDYRVQPSNPRNQQTMLRQLVRIAKFKDLPLVIHARNAKGSMAAYDDCLRILESELRPSHPVYLHCFYEDLSAYQRWIKAFPGLYLGMSPKIVWLPDTSKTLPVVRAVPLENILLESDAPFLPDY